MEAEVKFNPFSYFSLTLPNDNIQGERFKHFIYHLFPYPKHFIPTGPFQHFYTSKCPW